MAKGFLHLHTTVIFLFVIFYAIKVGLLLAGNTELLTRLRNKKFIDIILGVLILATGGYLFAINVEKDTWLIVKLVVVLALIPLSIVAMKKENKGLAVLTLLGFMYFIGVSYTKSLGLTPKKIEVKEKVDQESQIQNAQQSVEERGKAVYETACVSCHGPDGKLQAGGAKDLTKSSQDLEQRIRIITKGKGLMQSFEGRLTEDEIKAVATYTTTLR
ncbi:MAG TPA: SirB2 family protein [Cytophagales bacterium]|nr:SirB2 family protein [Cytophagales bacterium]